MLHRRIDTRHLLGIALAPLVTPLLFSMISYNVQTTVIVVVSSYAGMLLIGLPVIITLKKIKRLTLIWLGICGTTTSVIGFPIMLITVLWILIGNPWAYHGHVFSSLRAEDILSISGIGAIWGLITSTTYGLIAKVKFKVNAT